MSKKEEYIGVFDSGVGGLTVLKEIVERMPNENIIYFGDTARVPYGTKSKAQIIEFAKSDIEFLLRYDLKTVVIACNTADSVARSVLEENYNIPIYGVIEPASIEACNSTKNNHVGVMATSATVQSKAYDEAIHKQNPDVSVFSIACPLLVPLVEDGRYTNDDPIVKLVLEEYLNELLKNDIDTIILGCTHYPLLKDAIQELVPNINVISSSNTAVNALENGLKENDLVSEATERVVKYYVSDDPSHFKENAKIFIGKDFDGEVEKVNL